MASNKSADEVGKDLRKLMIAVSTVMNEIIASSGSKEFMLATPASLTVSIITGTNKAYKKKTHIGMETFRLKSTYVGARGDVIFVFGPVEAADYYEMELKEDDAKRLLCGFSDWVSSREVSAVVNGIHEQRSAERQRRELVEKVEQYDDFGAW